MTRDAKLSLGLKDKLARKREAFREAVRNPLLRDADQPGKRRLTSRFLDQFLECVCAHAFGLQEFCRTVNKSFVAHEQAETL